MGKKRNTASMLMVMGLIVAIIAFTQPILINSRVLLASTSMAENDQIDTSDETIHGFESVGTSSSLQSLSNTDRRQVLVKNQVYVFVSGPSDKGTGHK
ncbi:hypothetical protein RHMOL_Rhmol08G0113200 [Rhododendron molle]|uniref:Uncharacterized protein n=1 Tax=Rhododendron molle TaxID=49168 RepID=A0ACC0MMA1_RHOML|nr:hypothetical protein RHMOL_Rhmol08G0113200 [Rhododendron molle]